MEMCQGNGRYKNSAVTLRFLVELSIFKMFIFDNEESVVLALKIAAFLVYHFRK